jgi:hypothetical protein
VSNDRRAAERAARRAHIAREASGEARGFRYAIACSVGWVGPWHLPGPHVHDDSCTHREPVVYEGDRESAQARAAMHAERNGRGATHHSPEIVPEEYIARCAAQRRW